MRRDPVRTPIEKSVHTAAGEFSTIPADKQILRLGVSYFQILPDCMDDLVIDEYDPLLIAFSSHQQFPCLKVNICQADADTLTDTQAGICKDHRNRIVSLSGIHKYLLEKRLHIFLFYFRRACNFLLEFQPVLCRNDQIFLNSNLHQELIKAGQRRKFRINAFEFQLLDVLQV